MNYARFKILAYIMSCKLYHLISYSFKQVEIKAPIIFFFHFLYISLFRFVFVDFVLLWLVSFYFVLFLLISIYLVLFRFVSISFRTA
jgi:hypothetical protein